MPLRDVVFVPGHANILEDYLWIVLRTNEMATALRVFTLLDIRMSCPMRWLCGSNAKLSDWSVFKAGGLFELVETALLAIAADGKALSDPVLDIFGPIAA